MKLPTPDGSKECDCHDRFSLTLGHYLGLTLLFCAGAVLWLGVSGRVKETYIAGAMDLFKSLSTLIAGGFLTAWNPKQKDQAAGTKADPVHAEVSEEKK